MRTAANRHAATPVIVGNQVWVNSHTFGLICFEVVKTGSQWKANEKWANKDLKINLAEVKAKRTNLNPQELGDSAERAAQWKQWQTNPVFDEVEMEKMVGKGIEKLMSMQCSDGGWGWFSGYGEYSYPHTTAVVVHGLLVARQNGAKIPDAMLDAGLGWLTAYERKQVNALQASTRSRGGATITANNSVRQSLAAVAIPGLEIRQDGEVIRIEVPADKLFVPGTAQLQPDGYRILDEVAAAVQRTYPRQRIVIEGHTDDSLGANPTGAHALATGQAQAVFTQLVQRGRLPARQLSVMAMGENHPLASNGTPAGKAKNRRIEVVVYPDSIDG